MALTKYTLGDLLARNSEHNDELQYGAENVRGVLNAKGISNTKVSVEGRDLSKFLVVRPGGFIFNHRVHDKLGLGYNTSDEVYIFTNDYVAFYVKPEIKDTVLLPDYLYMWFLRSEFDRYMLFKTYGSATLFFNWDNMCELEITLPNVSVQQKYVDIYNAMVANQQSYENNLAETKKACDMFYDKCKQSNLTHISSLVEVNNKKNINRKYGFNELRGISDKNRFSQTTADVDENALEKYLVIEKGEFAVNFMCLGNWGRFYLAYNDSNENLIVSPACSALRIKTDSDLNPYYFFYLLQRDEFQRHCVFVGDGNTRGGINANDFGTIKIPLIERSQQDMLAKLFQAYESRKDINEKLKKQIKDICPILIRGSLEEGKS